MFWYSLIFHSPLTSCNTSVWCCIYNKVIEVTIKAEISHSSQISHYLDVKTGKLLMRMDSLLNGFKDEDLEEELEDEERYLELPTIPQK